MINLLEISVLKYNLNIFTRRLLCMNGNNIFIKYFCASYIFFIHIFNYLNIVYNYFNYDLFSLLSIFIDNNFQNFETL